METSALELLQIVVHWASLIGLVVATIFTISGMTRPEFFPKFFREFHQRKYIFSFGAFVVLLCGTIFIATQPNAEKTQSSQSQAQPIAMATEAPSTQSTQPETETIKTEDITVIEPVAFTKENRDDPTVLAGQSKIVQIGKTGQKSVTYQIAYDKGQEISRTLKSQKVTVKPVAEITANGTHTETLGAVAVAPEAKPVEASKAVAAAKPKAAEPQSKLPSIRVTCKKDEAKRSSLLNICLQTKN